MSLRPLSASPPRTAALAALTAVLAVLLLTLPGAAGARASLAGRAYVPGQVVVKRHGEPDRTIAVRNVRRALTRLRRRPDVAWAVPNYIAHASAFVPNDPGRDGAPGGWQAVQWNFTGPWSVNAPDAWANAMTAGVPGGKGVRVAVLDTGVAYADRGRFRRSPDLKRVRFAAGHDFVDGDSQPDDHQGHGTHVASTIAEATNNGVALTGLAYNATIIPVRVLDTQGEGDAATIGKGIRWATRHGAQVINLSLEFSTDVGASEVPQLLRAISYAHRKGVLIVGASGNEAHGSIAYPARASHVVSVGATTEHGCLASFSNQGRGLDVVAPGGGADAPLPGDPNCRPADPPGHDVYQLTYKGSSVRRFGLPGGYEGTSMAVPHVSATAALIIATKVIGPHPSPAAIEARLKATATDLGAPGPDTRYGAGLINAAKATDPAFTSQPQPVPAPAAAARQGRAGRP